MARLTSCSALLAVGFWYLSLLSRFPRRKWFGVFRAEPALPLIAIHLIPVGWFGTAKEVQSRPNGAA